MSSEQLLSCRKIAERSFFDMAGQTRKAEHNSKKAPTKQNDRAVLKRIIEKQK